MATSQQSIFIYKGLDRKGKKVEGELSGTSPALVKAQLLKQGVRPKIVRKKNQLLGGKKNKALGYSLIYATNGHHDESRRTPSTKL